MISPTTPRETTSPKFLLTKPPRTLGIARTTGSFATGEEDTPTPVSSTSGPPEERFW
jgi:hypothetical protein